jgi:hypothetical protein
MVMAVLLKQKQAEEKAEKKTPTCEQFSQSSFCQCWPSVCLLCRSWATRCNSDISISISVLPLKRFT